MQCLWWTATWILAGLQKKVHWVTLNTFLAPVGGIEEGWWVGGCAPSVPLPALWVYDYYDTIMQLSADSRSIIIISLTRGIT